MFKFKPEQEMLMPHDITITAEKTQDKSMSKNSKQDTLWMLGLYGTAIGAGTLFLPIDAGLHGIWPLLIMAALSFPMTYYPHLTLCRFVQSGSNSAKDFTDVVQEHFGKLAGHFLTTLYFLSIYPILLMYGVALTNTTQSFIVNQLGLTAPPRALLSFLLVAVLMAIVRLGQAIILKAINLLVYPFVTVLMLLSIYLIPHWNDAIFHASSITSESHGFFTTLWLMIPVMVFSFSHTPIISSFAMSQKERFGQLADKSSSRILKYSHIMMVVTVMFFVFSCVLSLSPHDLLLAKQQNISILSYLANYFNTPTMAYAAPIIAFVAISKSFLGHYMGAREGMHGLLAKLTAAEINQKRDTLIKYFIEIFMLITCWIIATINPNILTLIETLIGPIIAAILFVMPMYAIVKIPVLQKYYRRWQHCFVITIGCVSISALVFGVYGALVH